MNREIEGKIQVDSKLFYQILSHVPVNSPVFQEAALLWANWLHRCAFETAHVAVVKPGKTRTKRYPSAPKRSSGDLFDKLCDFVLGKSGKGECAIYCVSANGESRIYMDNLTYENAAIFSAELRQHGVLCYTVRT